MALRLLLVLTATLVPAVPALAALSFEPATTISGLDPADDPFLDAQPQLVAGDGAGGWLMFGRREIESRVYEYFLARSTDNAATWSGWIASPFEDVESLVGSGNGRFAILADGAVFYSDDAGATWTEAVHPEPADGVLGTNGQGRWLMVRAAPGLSRQVILQVSVSEDDAETWSAFSVDDFNPDAQITSQRVQRLIHANGTWMAALDWYGDSRSRVSLYAFRSTDGGVTWTSAVTGLEGVFSGPRSDRDPYKKYRLATDYKGTWLAAATFPDHFGGAWLGRVRSVDDGVTWETLERIADDGDATYDIGGHVLGLPSGELAVLWESPGNLKARLRGDWDVVQIRSFDGGETWSGMSAISTTAQGLIEDPPKHIYSLVAADARGTVVAAWDRYHPTLDARVPMVARSVEHCPAQPSQACLAPTGRGKSSLGISDGPGAADKLQWLWRGPGVELADLGDPVAGQGYFLCLYDDDGNNSVLVYEDDIPAGGVCAGYPCWQARGNSIKLKDRWSNRSGVRGFTAKTAASGAATIKLNTSGALTAAPALPLRKDDNVTLQLHAVDTGRCWEATYSSARKNSSQSFLARTP